MNVLTVIKLLDRAYGKAPARPKRDPLSELLLTILSQNTSDVNSDRTFASLQARFPTWEELAEADVADIAEAIKAGGLSQIKAARIKDILRRIRAERGNLELSFMADLPVPEARAWLTSLPGVGPKTAACVLLFSLGKPALPVDTHVHRVARRLGLAGQMSTPEQAQMALEAQVPPKLIYDFHINMIVHGRRTCHARNPECEVCVLMTICPSAPGFLAARAQRREAERA